MSRRKKNKEAVKKWMQSKGITPKEKRNKLDLYNVKNYYSDIDYINRLLVKQSTKEWIEITMYEHRARANAYEHNFAEFLIDKKVNFIHQAPFVFGGKIYFADFFIPDKHLVVEIDGDYHNGPSQYHYDKVRTACFDSVKIRTERISNHTTTNKEALALILSKYGIK